ncbi:TPA: hypothetical protein HA244_03480 [Candidatus Micrarchaeota archaeon]|nr:hypothetical protein [Candidatus Micrarchaeota archaeon]
MHETGWFGKIVHGIAQTIAKTISRFTAYSFLLISFGVIYGYYLEKIAAWLAVDKLILLFLPIVLAILAYFVTAIAIVLFIFLGIILLIVFI